MEEAKKTSGRGGWRGGGRPVTAYKVPLMVRISQEAAARYVVYYELPGCEQVSFHTNEPEAVSWPHYDGAWDGKKCSTLGKLESAIWQRYESELKAKYNV